MKRAAASRLVSAAVKLICSSRSAGMMGLHDRLRTTRLVQQHGERGQVAVPLDQRGHRTEARDGRLVEAPDLGHHAAVVGIDEDLTAFEGLAPEIASAA